jgi:hypothetical protein
MAEELEQLKIENAQLKATNQLLLHILILLRDVITNPGNEEARNNALNTITKIIGE